MFDLLDVELIVLGIGGMLGAALTVEHAKSLSPITARGLSYL